MAIRLDGLAKSLAANVGTDHRIVEGTDQRVQLGTTVNGILEEFWTACG